MKRNILGRSGIEVTELCLGALPMGPLQKNASVSYNTSLIAKALEAGINFIDTAQMYRTYPPIKAAIEQTGIRPVIATKSTASTYADMQAAVDEALNELGLDCIDIFHLHAARSKPDVFELRNEALKCLLDNKAAGRIKAVGISCHSPQVVMAAAQRNDIDVVFPIVNIEGLGIIDGTLSDMEQAIARCGEVGKGVYLMKILGGGNLVGKYAKCLEYARSLPGHQSISIGIVSDEELDYNLRAFSGEKLPDPAAEKKIFKVVRVVCAGCGECVETCPNEAISMFDGKADITTEKCIGCGYCVGCCPMFAIRKI
jgi:aryl-alcohol dehydrogenase-like predicted oxidoreductase